MPLTYLHTLGSRLHLDLSFLKHRKRYTFSQVAGPMDSLAIWHRLYFSSIYLSAKFLIQ